VLKDLFTSRGTFQIGEYIEFSMCGDPVYFGRIEEVVEDSPNRVELSLYGMLGELNEVFPGGFGQAGDNNPHRYAKSDYFANDPDHSIQSQDPVSQPGQIITLLHQHYIDPATNIDLGGIEESTPLSGLDSIILRGEENAASIIRGLAQGMKTASWGVDENKELFVKQLRSGVVQTFQEGVDCEQLTRTTDRSLLFNRLLLTGGYVYGGSGIGFYRFRATFRQQSSISTYGEKRARLFVPFIRRNSDAKQFAREFFRQYAKPTVRYTFQSNRQTDIIRPQDGRIEIKDASGSSMATMHFDRVHVQFDEIPIVTITIGPEDLQYPTPVESQRFEIAPITADARGDGELQPDVSVTSLGTFTGTSAS